MAKKNKKTKLKKILKTNNDKSKSNNKINESQKKAINILRRVLVNNSEGDAKEQNSPTLLELIKNKKNLEEVQLVDSMNNGAIIKNIQKEKDSEKKEVLEKQNQISSNNEEADKNEYIKKLKPKIVMINGKMVIEKTDIGLINKKYNEEHYNRSSPKETIFVSSEEKVNSLSFLKILPTKKWPKEETDNFYKALKLFGLDFSFLEIVLHPRKRIEIKRKYLKEKKENPQKIQSAISSRKNVDKLNKILNLYKKQNNQKNSNSLVLIKEESFKKKNGGVKEETIDYNKEYKKILNE